MDTKKNYAPEEETLKNQETEAAETTEKQQDDNQKAEETELSPEEALAKGMEDCLRAVSTLKECQASGTWPCYTREIITLGLPKWAA